MASDGIGVESMRYDYKYQTKAIDFWQLAMYGIYGSMVGLVNVIFTVAMVIVSLKFWQDASLMNRLFMLFGLCLFTGIQPMLLYQKAKKQEAAAPKETHLSFTDSGLTVKVDQQSSHLAWKDLRGVAKKPSLLIVYSGKQHGFVLPNRVIGEDRAKLYEYLRTKIDKK